MLTTSRRKRMLFRCIRKSSLKVRKKRSPSRTLPKSWNGLRTLKRTRAGSFLPAFFIGFPFWWCGPVLRQGTWQWGRPFPLFPCSSCWFRRLFLTGTCFLLTTVSCCGCYLVGTLFWSNLSVVSHCVPCSLCCPASFVLFLCL